jgi:hypothetical protein
MSTNVAKPSSSSPAKALMTSVSPISPPRTAESKPNSGAKPDSLLVHSPAPVSADTRRAMIAEAAYYIAEQRGFSDGRDVEDWLLAEKQIDAGLSP